jgi:hypothetical protein
LPIFLTLDQSTFTKFKLNLWFTLSPDYDNDGIVNLFDEDDDGDGLLDSEDDDDDGNGVKDSEEDNDLDGNGK